MNILKGFSDMATMVKAAPALIESANQLSAQAQAAQLAGATAAQQWQQATAGVGEPDAAALQPIAGVDLALYTRIVKSAAASGFGDAQLTATAASFGVAAGPWASAQAGWGERIRVDRTLGHRFNALYLEA